MLILSGVCPRPGAAGPDASICTGAPAEGTVSDGEAGTTWGKEIVFEVWMDDTGTS